ncbi:unnamed protein product [Nippostrongylus brasiliensis]|uniref:Mitochondrial import receptor subunit TOM7 homolog n=1 Tax=Nippostrongylus brasiliensis TaxID=27835 RepID=A0A0N4XXI3_NIPBR|nr:unnamed protein product [Nippostrongylus brasiliensis]
MQLSHSQKQLVLKTVNVSTFVFQWGFVPFVVYLGFRKGPEPLPNGQFSNEQVTLVILQKTGRRRCRAVVKISRMMVAEFLVAMTMLRTNNDLLFLSSPASLCSILKVADYFECPTLIRRVLATINDKLVGESPSDICEAFNILSDRTAEQRSQMEHENVWNFNC